MRAITAEQQRFLFLHFVIVHVSHINFTLAITREERLLFLLLFIFTHLINEELLSRLFVLPPLVLGIPVKISKIMNYLVGFVCAWFQEIFHFLGFRRGAETRK